MKTLAALAPAWLLLAAPVCGGEIVEAELVGHWDEFDGSYADVWGEGDFAFLAHFGYGSIDIVDISDPANPIIAAFYVPPPPGDDASAQDVKVAAGLMFIGLEGGDDSSAHIADVRDPENPAPVADIAIPGFGGVHNVFYHQGFLYMADSSTPRVAIVDLTSLDPDDPPAEPITETKWMLADVGDSFVHDVTVVGDRLYVSAWDAGIWIYDVSGVESEPPQFLGSGPGENTHSAWPTDDGRFVITGEERTGGGITAYRISESPPSVTLEITDRVSVPESEASSVHNQVVIGRRVYNSWYGAGLRVYDVAPVTGQLQFVASYDTSEIGSAWGVYPFLGQRKVLLSDIGDGLFIIEVTAPMPADLNGDGEVGFADLLELLNLWGLCDAPCAEDLDQDGAIGLSDLLILLSAWK